MKQTVNPNGFRQRHLDKIGVGGSIFAALCCLDFPALLSLLSATGLGFLINDAILLPLLIVFLLLTIAGLAMGMRRHRKPWALLLGVVSATALVVVHFRLVQPVAGRPQHPRTRCRKRPECSFACEQPL